MKRFFTFFVCFILLMSASVSWADITTWGDLKTALSNGGTVTLTQDITASNTDTAIEVTKTATLDLNGYTLNANGRYFSVITVNDSNGSSITFTLKDSSANKTGKITGGVCSSSGDENNRDGGGICVKSGTFKMEGGNITGNKAKLGGGIFVDQSAILNITGGSITSNTSNTTEGGGGGI